MKTYNNLLIIFKNVENIRNNRVINMKKRGQLSILLVIALIVIIIFSLLYALKLSIPGITSKTEIIKSSIAESLRSNIQSCLINTANSAVLLLGLQGSYIEKPSKFLTINDSILSFGYYKNSATINSLDGIKTEINNYIEKNLPACVSTVQNKKLIFESGNPISKTTINEDNIKIEVNYPIKIKQNERVDSLTENYNTELKIRLGYLYDFVLSIITKHLKDPNNIDIANLLKSDLTIDILGYKNNVLIYVVTDKKSKINNKPFTFVFANYFGI